MVTELLLFDVFLVKVVESNLITSMRALVARLHWLHNRRYLILLRVPSDDVMQMKNRFIGTYPVGHYGAGDYLRNGKEYFITN